jgi:hypothetical protein
VNPQKGVPVDNFRRGLEKVCRINTVPRLDFFEDAFHLTVPAPHPSPLRSPQDLINFGAAQIRLLTTRWPLSVFAKCPGVKAAIVSIEQTKPPASLPAASLVTGSCNLSNFTICG